MKHSLKISAVVAAIAALGTTALADTPVGTWNGKLEMKMPPMPANADPSMKAMIEKQMETFKKMVLVLSLNKDKSFKMTVTGLPAGTPGGERTQVGTWTQKGNDVTLTPKADPKNPRGNTPVTLKVTGKTLVIAPPAGSQGQGKVTFTRAK